MIDILITGFNCLAQSIGLTLTINFLGTTTVRKTSEIIKVFFIIFICDIITFGKYEYLSLPLIMLAILIYFHCQNKNIIGNLIIIIICIMILLIMVILVSFLLLPLFSKNIEYLKETFIYNLICGLSYISLVLLSRRFLNKIGSALLKSQFLQKLNGIIPNILVINIIIILIIIFLLPYIFEFENNRLYKIIYIVFAFIFTQFTLNYFFVLKHFVTVETEKAKKSKELELTVEFQKSIEKMYDDVMNFKHDYIKIYSTFKIFIEKNDMPSLREYFDQNITSLQNQLHLQQFNVKSLINIKDIALQGIIYTSLLKAENLGISISIDIQEEINDINIQIIDLCRIVGIFLDNAIEANESIHNSYVNVCLFEKNNSIVIIIENSCSDTININSITNYSAKGNDRGRGLNIVKLIIKNYNNVINNTFIADNKFVQELWILKKDSK